MARSVVQYDKDLPEIPDRLPYLPPDSHLVKKSNDEFVLEAGRRPSRMLLVNKLRDEVDKWRADGYPGSSDVTKRLFHFWFEEDHFVGGEPFRFHFGQREAIETLVHLVEVRNIQDVKCLIDSFADIFPVDLFTKSVEHQTTMDGVRQIRRFVPELKSDAVQTLPPEDLARFALKMATGSGKTVVMAMVMVWSYLHRSYVRGSGQARNFAIIAPNVIVYQRLERDFAHNAIFKNLPLIPPEFPWNLRPVMRGDVVDPSPQGNIFLTNIQQLRESSKDGWDPINAIDAILGRKPLDSLSAYRQSMLDALRELPDLAVFNDEAHHVHDDELAWNRTLMSLHQALPHGLTLWLDFSATPKDQNGSYYPWIVCDYPLAQAVEDRIVKAPLIVHQVDRTEPQSITRDNVVEAYEDWIVAALQRLRAHEEVYQGLGVKPVLFIMAEKSLYADAIGEWLRETRELGLSEDEVLVIHTNTTGEVTQGDLEKARKAAASVDDPDNPVKVIVSVLMLREGWDVRSVTVILGLRPFTATAQILPEQAVGRGLRLVRGISPDQTQTLEVMGTSAFENFVRQLEVEGLGIRTVDTPPPPPVKIEPVQEKLEFDIGIPLTKIDYTREYPRLSLLKVDDLSAIYDIDRVGTGWDIRLRMEFATTSTEVHRVTLASDRIPLAEEVISTITTKTLREAGIPSAFAELYPSVRVYLRSRCFAGEVDLQDVHIRQFLSFLQHQDTIARYLGRIVGRLTAVERALEFDNPSFRLSDTEPFIWRRKHVRCEKTVFNYVATYNPFETNFANFLDEAPDVERFAALAEHFTRFRIAYINSRGAIKFYYPDFVAVQHLEDERPVHWVIETKGRVFDDVPYKDAAMERWCERISEQVEERWRYMRVDQRLFESSRFETFEALRRTITGVDRPTLGLMT